MFYFHFYISGFIIFFILSLMFLPKHVFKIFDILLFTFIISVLWPGVLTLSIIYYLSILIDKNIMRDD